MRRTGTVCTVALAALVASVAPSTAGKLKLTGSACAGYGSISEKGAPSGSVGFRDGVFALITPGIALGPELGYYDLGSTARELYWVSPETDFRALQATLQLQFRGPGGKLRPFATAGGGYYDLAGSSGSSTPAPGGTPSGPPLVRSNQTRFGFNFGGGVRFKPSPSGVAVGIDARYHSITKVRIAGDKSVKLITVMAGIHFG